jgi:hypothetical protein
MSTIFNVERFLRSRALCIASGEMVRSSVDEKSCVPAMLLRGTAMTQSPITMKTAAQADEMRTCRIDISRSNRQAELLRKYQLRCNLVSEGGFESAELMGRFLD